MALGCLPFFFFPGFCLYFGFLLWLWDVFVGAWNVCNYVRRSEDVWYGETLVIKFWDFFFWVRWIQCYSREWLIELGLKDYSSCAHFGVFCVGSWAFESEWVLRTQGFLGGKISSSQSLLEIGSWVATKFLVGSIFFPFFILKQNHGVFETFMCLACYGGLWKWVKFPSWMKNFSLLRGIHLLLA